MAGSMSGAGVATWVGAGRSVVRFTGTFAVMPTAFDALVPITKATDCIRLAAFRQSDHKTGWAFGIWNDAGTYKLSIRRITNGVYEAFAAPRTATIASSTGVPGTLRVIVRNDVWTLTLARPGLSDISLTYTNSVDPTYNQFDGWGLESDVDGATAGPVQITRFEITPTQLLDIPCIVGDSVLHANFGDNSLTPIGSRVLVGDRVSMCVHNGEVVALGSGKTWRYNLIDRTATMYVASVGTLPGGTASDTDASQVLSWRGSLGWISGRRLLLSAIGADTDLDTGDPRPGGAVELTFSEPIVSWTVSQSGVLIVGMKTKFATVTGDGVTSAISRVEHPIDAGPTGPDAAIALQSAGVMMHTNAGIVLVSDFGGAKPVSSPRLRAYLQPSLNDPLNREYIVGRDPQSQIFYFFRAGQSEHVLFDEMHDAYLVDSFPAAWTVTAAANVRGQLWIGCSDGKVRRFDDGAGGTDESLAINDVMPLIPIDDEGLLTDVRLRFIQPLLSLPTNGRVTMAVYLAADRESVYDATRRTKAMETTWIRGQPPIFVDQSAPVVMVEIRGQRGVRYALEYMEAGAEVMPGSMLSFGMELATTGPDTYPIPSGGVGGGNEGPGPGPVTGGGVTPDDGTNPPAGGGSTGTIGPGAGGVISEDDMPTPGGGDGPISEGGTLEPVDPGIGSDELPTDPTTPIPGTGTIGPGPGTTEEPL